MTWAWSQTLRPTTKLVLMSLSDNSNDFRPMLFLQSSILQKKCCLSTRHTQREIQKLVNLGLLKIQKRTRKDGSRSSNLYLLNLSKCGGDDLSPHENNGSECQQVVTPVTGGDDPQVIPLTTKEPLINPTTTTTENWHWPKQLSETERDSIQKLVVGISNEIVQQFAG